MGESKQRKVCDVQTGSRLKEYLKRIGATHADLAAVADVTESNMDKTLNGNQGLNVEKLVKFYEWKQIEPNEIILGEEYASKFKYYGMNSAAYDIFIKSGKTDEDVLLELMKLSDEDFEKTYDCLMRCLLDERTRRKKN